MSLYPVQMKALKCRLPKKAVFNMAPAFVEERRALLEVSTYLSIYLSPYPFLWFGPPAHSGHSLLPPALFLPLSLLSLPLPLSFFLSLSPPPLPKELSEAHPPSERASPFLAHEILSWVGPVSRRQVEGHGLPR